jgi:hypothetical protein
VTGAVQRLPSLKFGLKKLNITLLFTTFVFLLLWCYTIMSLDFNPNMVAIFSMVFNFVVFLTRMV